MSRVAALVLCSAQTSAQTSAQMWCYCGPSLCRHPVRVLLGLPLRQTQGFIQSLLDLMGLALAVSDYSTLSRRQGPLAVILPRQRPDTPMHLVVDSTG